MTSINDLGWTRRKAKKEILNALLQEKKQKAFQQKKFNSFWIFPEPTPAHEQSTLNGTLGYGKLTCLDFLRISFMFTLFHSKSSLATINMFRTVLLLFTLFPKRCGAAVCVTQYSLSHACEEIILEKYPRNEKKTTSMHQKYMLVIGDYYALF